MPWVDCFARDHRLSSMLMTANGNKDFRKAHRSIAQIERVTVTVVIGIMPWEAFISVKFVGRICIPWKFN